MTLKRISLLYIIFLLSMTGCENKKTDLSNAAFRKMVIPKITDTNNINTFETLLTRLDKKGISYCQFIHRFSEIEDSCYNMAKKKYPDPENEEDFVRANLKAVEEAESNYLIQMNITKDLSTFATSEYNSDQNIKSFCDKH